MELARAFKIPTSFVFYNKITPYFVHSQALATKYSQTYLPNSVINMSDMDEIYTAITFLIFGIIFIGAWNFIEWISSEYSHRGSKELEATRPKIEMMNQVELIVTLEKFRSKGALDSNFIEKVEKRNITLLRRRLGSKSLYYELRAVTEMCNNNNNVAFNYLLKSQQSEDYKEFISEFAKYWDANIRQRENN